MTAAFQFGMTIFPDTWANSKTEKTLSISELADALKSTHAKEKGGLPLIKLATFGDVRTENNCLRHEGNILTITGIEGDYDGEKMDAKEAADLLAGICSIVATSPSHTPMKPRWRVLAFFSKPLPPQRRTQMLNRLNGRLRGVLANESWTPPQSYFAGYVDGNDDHEVHVIPGDFIDTLPQLDVGAIGKPDKKAQKLNGHAVSSFGFNFEKRQIGQEQLRLVLSQMPNDPAAFEPGDRKPAWFDYSVWIEIAHAIAGCTGKADWARAAFMDWSLQFDGEESKPEQAWESIRREDIKAGLSTLIRYFDEWYGEGAFVEKCQPKITPKIESCGEPDHLYDPWSEYMAPAFPLDVLPPRARTFVEAKTIETGADVSAVAMAVMAVASAASTHEAVLYLKHGKNFGVRCRLWVMLVGSPSSKKSPATGGAVAPLQRAQNAVYAAWYTRKQQAKADKVDFTDPEPEQYLCYDVTMEKLGDLLSRQNRGILSYHDELSGFIGAFDRYGGPKGGASDRAFYLKLYDGGPYHFQRIGRETTPIFNLSASLLGGVQPTRLRELKNLSSDGLLQRFIPVIMRRPKLDSDDFNAAAGEEWERYVRWLLEFGRFATELSVEARRVRGAIREYLFTGSQVESEGEAFQGFIGKLDGVWGSLCLLLHIMWGHPASQPVSAGTAEMASYLIREFILPHGLAFYRSIAGGAQDDHRSIGAFITRFEGQTIKVRDFSRGPRCFKGLAPDEVAKKVAPFIAGGWIEQTERGPHCTSWNINPQVRGSFLDRADHHYAWVKSLQTKLSGMGEEE